MENNTWQKISVQWMFHGVVMVILVVKGNAYKDGCKAWHIVSLPYVVSVITPASPTFRISSQLCLPPSSAPALALPWNRNSIPTSRCGLRVVWCPVVRGVMQMGISCLSWLWFSSPQDCTCAWFSEVITVSLPHPEPGSVFQSVQ